MFTLFVIKKDSARLYITTSDKYSEVLQELDVSPERIIFWTISLEQLFLIADNQIGYIMREH